MASEIQIRGQLNVTKGNLKFQSPNISFAPTMSGTHRSGAAQSIGITQEAITIAADVANLGWAVFTNTDDTATIEIGVEVGSVFYPLVDLLPGESCVFRLHPDAAPYARASLTAGAVLDHTIFEL
jgi:hypothetical protein